MLDGKKIFINKTTGELIFRRTRWSAIRYFKADGKACGYPFKKSDVIALDGITFGMALAKIIAEEKADGIA